MRNVFVCKDAWVNISSTHMKIKLCVAIYLYSKEITYVYVKIVAIDLFKFKCSIKVEIIYGY